MFIFNTCLYKSYTFCVFFAFSMTISKQNTIKSTCTTNLFYYI